MPITIIVIALIALWLAYAIRKIRRRETGGCDGDCKHCRKQCK